MCICIYNLCIICIAQLSLAQQIELVSRATVLLSEHGTTSYSVLFMRDGAAALCIGKPPMKEAQILLQVYFFFNFFWCYMRDGASALCIGKPPMKEAQTLLQVYNIHIYILYVYNM
jgi:hypothetical protein